MATSVFTPYVDKENVTAIGMVPRTKGIASGKSNIRGGKIFQKNTPHSIPRKALGVVNGDSQRTTLGDINNKLKKPQSAAPIKKLFSETSRPGSTTRNAVKQSQSQKIQSHGPVHRVKTEQKTVPVVKEVIEKEYMPSYPDSDDDFEDVVRRSERSSTYFDKLLSWQPSRMCSTGISYDSDDEPYTKCEIPETEAPILNSEFEESCPFLLDDPCNPLGDIALPSLDDLYLPDMNEELATMPEF
ncbi:uncharacterized protein LOC135489690 isoform X2 [Lineus longissimus]